MHTWGHGFIFILVKSLPPLLGFSQDLLMSFAGVSLTLCWFGFRH